jgi:hypothetical protein
MPVDVLKPATAQPWSPNEFSLVLRDHALASNTRLIAEVRDQTDAVVYTQRLPEQRDSHYKLHLPVETWAKLTPQSELFLVVSSEDDKTGSKIRLQEKVPLFGPVYTTMLATDRSTYRPGETLYFRSLTLDRATFQPPTREQFFKFDLVGPHQHIQRSVAGGTDLIGEREGRVEPILGPDSKPIRGIGCGSFTLPPDLKDGDYILRLIELPHPAGYPVAIHSPVTRSIKVLSGAIEDFAKQVGFAAASYSAGGTVDAWAELKFQDKPVPGAEVKVAVLADNALSHDIAAPATGADGRSYFRFKLPLNLNKGDVRLRVTFTARDKNIEESVVERVPVIVGRSLKIEFFPEGGTLVAGVPCRVYVRATTPAGQPVDIRGTITDGKNTLARVETFTDRDQPGVNRGLGSFTYIPALGTPAWLKLESPSEAFVQLLDGPLPVAPTVVAGAPAVIAAHTGFQLPAAEADGVAISVLNPVSSPREPIRVNFRSAGQNRNLIVGAYTRGRLSDTKRISTDPHQVNSLELMAGQDSHGGVVRITVFEEPAEHVDVLEKTKTDLKPIAERLVFRKPSETLKLSIDTSGSKTESGAFAANSPIELTITASDEKGKPAAAILWAAAVNTGTPRGKTDRLINTHFLLAGDVTTPDSLEHADFLLTEHPKAAEALDLVLATQGWRKFVEQHPTEFAYARGLANQNPEKSNFQESSGQYTMRAEQPGMREQRRLYESYWPRYETASKALLDAQAAYEALGNDKSTVNRILELTVKSERAKSNMNAAEEQAREATKPVERLRGAGWYGVAGFGLLAVMLGTLALVLPLGRLPYGIGTVGSVGLVAFLVITLGMAERTMAAMEAHHEAIAKHEPIAERILSRDLNAKVEEKPNEKRIEILSKSQDAVMQSEGLQSSKGSAAIVPNSAGGLPMRPKNTPNSSDKAIPPLAPEAMTPGGTMKPATALPPGNAVPGGGGYGGSRGGVPPKMEHSPNLPPTAPIPPTAPKGTGLGSAKERDGINNWQSIAPRKNNPDWDLTEKATLRSRQIPQERNVGLTESAANTPLKRSDEPSYRKATDRAPAENEAIEDGKRRLAAKEDQPNMFLVPRLSLNDGETPTNADRMAVNRVKAALRMSQTNPPLFVREYAAPRPGPGTDGIDSERSDTILWQPVIVLPGDGKAKLNFFLGAAKGGYRVVIAGHTLDGRIGAVREVISVSPQVTPAMPPMTVPSKVP